MSTRPVSNMPSKGVRRPLGNINVNRAGAKHNSDGKAPTKALVIVKPTTTSMSKQAPSNFSSTTHPSASASSSVEVNTVVPSENADGFEPSQVNSIFRQPPSEGSTSYSIDHDDMLSLQLANSVHDDESDDEETTIKRPSDKEESICLAFTRADGCRIFEPFEASNVRSVFRRPLVVVGSSSSDQLDDDAMLLKRATPIRDDDDVDDINDDQPQYSSSSTTTLQLQQGHMSEQMSILDMM